MGAEVEREVPPWRLTDEDRVLYSETIPGHLWNAVRRICECGAEVGVACDKETVEQHLDAAATCLTPPADPREQGGER